MQYNSDNKGVICMKFQKGFVRAIKEHGCAGRKIAVTGASGGLGVELCRLILSSGGELIVVDRNESKQKALIEKLKKEYKDAKIIGELADMSVLESVKSLADRLKTHNITDLILNAGAYSIPRCKCDTGYDNVFTINCISPLYLTRALIDTVKENGGRIVAVGSIAHRYSHIDIDDIDFLKRKKSSLVYGNAKRYLMYSFFRMRREGEPLVIAHPGITFTGITAHYPKWLFAIIKHPMKIVFMKPKKAALSIFYSLFITPMECFWVGPRYFDIWGLPDVKELKSCKADEYDFISETTNEIMKSLEKDN